MKNKTNKITCLLITFALVITMMLPSFAFAADEDPAASGDTTVTEETGTGGQETPVAEEPPAGTTEPSEPAQTEPAQPAQTQPAQTTQPTTTTTTKPKTTTAKAPKGSYLSNGWYKPTPNKSYKGKNATKIPVLTYHRLASDKEKKKYDKRNSLVVSESQFRQQMKYLHDNHYRTISMEEFYLWYKGKIKLPKKSVLITFDDGYYSVIKYGLPILKKYNQKATMFVIGSRIKKKTVKTASKGWYRSVGLDVMKQVNTSYPNLEFQSHTYNMHQKMKGEKPFATHKSQSFINNDMKTMYNKFHFQYLAYPFGKYNNKTVQAASKNHILMAFTYGSNGYATRKQGRYKIRRIKVNGNYSFKQFKKWLVK